MELLKGMKICLTLLSVGLVGCGYSSKPESGLNSEFVQYGKGIVERRCESCHNIETMGVSPRADAPPLRTVLSQYNVEALGEDFREHIHVGHPDMPDFDFNVKQTEAVVAYLTSIQVKSNVN